jgi:asparagine synthase (glutamine-hydrolysing)
MAAVGGDLPAGAESALRAMARAVGHRGPDAERLLLDAEVGLGFRRLALVGPDSGDQPLFSEDEQVVLIANGEVYNHLELAARMPGRRLRTRSDCEVLAHLYARDGVRFLDEVVGMFAIVLWDRRYGKLVLARDRFGIKPLYYTRTPGAVLFASEIKALFTHPDCPRELNWAAALADQSMNVAPYLTSEPVNTWFEGIEIVPAGAVVTIDLATGRTDQRIYWSLPAFDGDLDVSDEEFIRAYRDRLGAAVDDAATADAELGLFLSGGVDSGAVAALAAARGHTLHTFTVLSGSTAANGDAEFGHRAAKALGLPNHQVLFDADRVPRAEEWKNLLWLMETPLCGPEQFYKYELYRYAKHLRPELRGMLLGAGSDEYNGGFSTVFGLDHDWAGFDAGVRQMARSTALHARPGLVPWWDHHESPLLSDELVTAGRADLGDDPYPAYVAWRHRHLQQYNCWHEDRSAAGNGVEARVPFLDHRLVELVARIPAGRRPGLLWDKRILREGVRDLLPEFIVNRPKVPFYHGDGAGFTHHTMVRMLTNDAGALVEEALATPGARRFLRADAMRGMLARLTEEAEPWGVEVLLRLVNLGLLDRMTRDVPAPPLDFPRREVLPAVAITDWDRDAPAAMTRLNRRDEPGLSDVITFKHNVLRVQAREEPDRVYLAVDGSFKYVADAAEDPAWYAFLQSVDGSRTLGELLETCGHPYPTVQDTLLAAIDAGVLRGVKA